jgi:hypothetical protein
MAGSKADRFSAFRLAGKRTVWLQFDEKLSHHETQLCCSQAEILSRVCTEDVGVIHGAGGGHGVATERRLVRALVQEI